MALRLAQAQVATRTEFRVEVAQERDGVRIVPVGEVDPATIGRLRARFDEATAAGARRVVLDLRQATFLDSTGLHLAIDAADGALMGGPDFAIIAGPPVVHRTFELAELSDRLPFVEVPLV